MLLVPAKVVFIRPGAGAVFHLFVLSGVETLSYNYQHYLGNCQYFSLPTEALQHGYRSQSKVFAVVMKLVVLRPITFII